MPSAPESTGRNKYVFVPHSGRSSASEHAPHAVQVCTSGQACLWIRCHEGALSKDALCVSMSGQRRRTHVFKNCFTINTKMFAKKKFLRGINFVKSTKLFSSPRDSPRSAWELQKKSVAATNSRKNYKKKITNKKPGGN